MLNSVQGYSPSRDKSPLERWVDQTLWLRGVRVKFRLRGNNLHILCESKSCPDRSVILTRLLLALQQVDLNTLLTKNQPAIYQILVYGRKTRQNRADWIAPIHLNQVDRHLEELRQSQSGLPYSNPNLTQVEPEFSHHSWVTAASGSTFTALVLSNRSLARQGQPGDIARYLGETLSALGISVKVTAKALPYTDTSPISLIPNAVYAGADHDRSRRLWITCESLYSPDPILIGEPIAEKLRDLELEHYQDAIILIQVTGEQKPDWLLRVDLTPASEMLREWARWGDPEAIARLLQQAISEPICLSTASLQESTLHLFFSYPQEHNSYRDGIPDKDKLTAIATSLLESLGPQGIHAATLYGQRADQETPAWVSWLNLPAAKYPALADSVTTLTYQGDWGAIGFALQRLLNPDLDKYLATGGIRFQCLLKKDLLHVMSDAAVCPLQSQVGPLVVEFFKELALPEVAGVRVYGRRSGQKRPLWSYGSDFVPRRRLVPEATPDFAATDAYVGDLIAHPAEHVLRPDLTPKDLQSVWEQTWQRWIARLQQVLLRSQLFTAIAEQDLPTLPDPSGSPKSVRTALVWTAMGLLMTVQANILLTRWAQPTLEAQPPASTAAPTSASATDATSDTPSAHPETSASRSQSDPDPTTSSERSPSPDVTFRQPAESDSKAFNSTGFTQSEPIPTAASAEELDMHAGFRFDAPESIVSRPASLPQPTTATLLAEEMPFATFNSRQLDEKLALYHYHLERLGHPPDVLVIGSSRALRGIDPIALQQALADLGYPDVEVFNFGVNGATAQVVDLIVRRLLPPDQLPRLIVWADGARAFNSGTEDTTYEGIALSAGYQQLAVGQSPLLSASMTTTSQPSSPSQAQGLGAVLQATYQNLDETLSQHLGTIATAHQQRDRLKNQVQSWLTGLLPNPNILPSQPPNSPSVLVAGQDVVDINGFLPLAVRYNPATYFQQYARVAGQYDTDYEDFRIAGRQAAAMNALLEFTRSRDLPVVFVNLPLTQEYLDPVRLQYERDFKKYMLSVAAVQQGGLIFRDLGEDWLTAYDYFSDPSHLNRYGAYQMSLHLANDPMIPWAQSE